MAMLIFETFSSLPIAEASPETHEKPADHWILPELDTAPVLPDETTAGEADGAEHPPKDVTTVPPAPSISAAVLRKRNRYQAVERQVTLLQQWECIVLGVQNELIECEMHDLTNESQPVEFAEIYIDEFNLFDRPLLNEGAVFYWSIGREQSRSGTIRRFSEIRIRRMPPLSKSRKREIERQAKEYSEFLKNLRGSPAPECR